MCFACADCMYFVLVQSCRFVFLTFHVAGWAHDLSAVSGLSRYCEELPGTCLRDICATWHGQMYPDARMKSSNVACLLGV